jgi:serine phosphatase RsbU (regulator of sigma subunit)
VALYWCDGEDVGQIKGDRYAIGDKRVPQFSNQSTLLDPNVTFYLTTDGLLDQAGGPKGFSFGRARFAELLKRHARQPFDDQKRAFRQALADYQGELAQRDDITVLSFRFK